MGQAQARIVLERKARIELERLLADGNTPQKIAKRARIVLMTADGHGVMGIMREIGVSKTTVWRWQDYFAEAGVEGLIKGRSKPPGRKPLDAAIKLKVVEKTVKERPANATHWSVRSMADEIGISHTSVQRIWAEHGLKPNLLRGFKVSSFCARRRRKFKPIIELQPGTCQQEQACQVGLALLDRLAPQIIAVQLDQVEGVEEDEGVVAAVADAVEARHAVVAAAHRLAVDDAGARAQAGERLHAVGQVVAGGKTVFADRQMVSTSSPIIPITRTASATGS
jgi:transposase